MGAGDRPLLVVVTGPPASGKTSVAEELASRLGVAFLSKDTFKEVLYEHLGSGDDLEPTLDAAALAALLRLAAAQLAAGLAFIVESNFDARFDPGPLRALAERARGQARAGLLHEIGRLAARALRRTGRVGRSPSRAWGRARGRRRDPCRPRGWSLGCPRAPRRPRRGRSGRSDGDVDALITRIEEASGGSLSVE